MGALILPEPIFHQNCRFLAFFLRFMAVDLFIMSQGIIGNKMKEFFFSV